MSFGSRSRTGGSGQHYRQGSGTGGSTPDQQYSSGSGGGKQGNNSNNNNGMPYTPTPANTSVLMAGLMGLRPRVGPALSTAWTSSSFARRPNLVGRSTLGGS